MLVRLVRTGFTVGLSQPTDFEDIKSEIQSLSDYSNVATASLETAIKFAMDLRDRESRAFPLNAIAAKGREIRRSQTMRALWEEGYPGPDLDHSQTSWLELAPGQVVAAPITLGSCRNTLHLRGK